MLPITFRIELYELKAARVIIESDNPAQLVSSANSIANIFLEFYFQIGGVFTPLIQGLATGSRPSLGRFAPLKTWVTRLLRIRGF